MGKSLIKFRGYVIASDSVVAVSSVYAEVDSGAWAFQILVTGGHSITVTQDVGAPERRAKIARWDFLRRWRLTREQPATS